MAFELQQNTQAIQAQTRYSITEKQMEFAGWFGTNMESADVYVRGNASPDDLSAGDLDLGESHLQRVFEGLMITAIVGAIAVIITLIYLAVQIRHSLGSNSRCGIRASSRWSRPLTTSTARVR